jgi:L-iditol 2-dehydrogenase
MQTTGVLIERDTHSVVVGDLEVPAVGANDVLVSSKVVGICRSDIELRDGHLDAQLAIPYPIVPGHEWSGEVVEVGRNVSRLKPGDPVVGECVYGPNLWFGFTMNGAASNLFTVPDNLLHKLPADVSFEQGAMVEPFTIAYRAIFSSGGVDGGDVVTIIGGGMIGQCALAACRAMGATTVVIEPMAVRRELAERMGADVVIDPIAVKDIAATVREITDSEGADFVLECSGTPAGLATTFKVVRFAGRVTNIGICAAESVPAQLGLIQSKDLLVRGVTGSPGVWPRALRFLGRHKIDLSPLVSKRFSFEQFNEAFAAAENTSENVKVHLRP